ncbi:unnamed protein product [Menidia menidia]|uniref:(Atlantic silverside) hypothetical protein n=1 Tax=Menidia menidia TaxID=238744 RepID=A0A8S4AIG0_9TELE|nr:unnamed protein product [Menidia menidia]
MNLSRTLVPTAPPAGHTLLNGDQWSNSRLLTATRRMALPGNPSSRRLFPEPARAVLHKKNPSSTLYLNGKPPWLMFSFRKPWTKIFQKQLSKCKNVRGMSDFPKFLTELL